MRFAALVTLAALTLPMGWAQATPTNVIIKAEYEEPTRRYAHGILGDDIEWGALRLTADMCQHCESRNLREFVIRLPETRVFEDVAPRIVDLEGEGSPAVIVVESDHRLGARLAIYSEVGLMDATPFIGRLNRWLAPIGAADLDGDGHVEIAYVDRPHLAKTIRIWRYRDGTLEPVVDLPGFTNHRIGERDIVGGIRLCNDVPEMIVASADWARLVAVRFDGAVFKSRDIGPHEGRESFARVMQC